MLSRVQAGVGYPLSYVAIGRDHRQFPQQLQRTYLADAGNALKELKTQPQQLVRGD